MQGACHLFLALKTPPESGRGAGLSGLGRPARPVV